MARKSANNVSEVQEMNEEQVYDGSVDTTEENVSTEEEIEEKIYLVDDIKEKMNALDIVEIREIIDYGSELIKEREEKEVSELDRQIAELMEKRNAIKPVHPEVELETTGKKRDIKSLKLTDGTFYTVGKRPKLLDDMLKESLGDKYGDRGAEIEQIRKWKEEQNQ